MLNPFKGKRFQLTSRFGWRTLNGARENHKGIDLVGLDSDQIVAIAPGTVVRSRMVTDRSNATWAWGNYVAIQQTDGNVCYYCHLKERKVVVGQKVKRGDLIGIEGNTGRVYSSTGGSGIHLHIGIHNKNGVWFDIAEYMGIKNQAGVYTDASSAVTATPSDVDHASEVCRICGLEQQTKDYLNKYTYAKDLWRKLYDKLKK